VVIHHSQESNARTKNRDTCRGFLCTSDLVHIKQKVIHSTLLASIPRLDVYCYQHEKHIHLHNTHRTPAVDNEWISVTYGNGLFVAVSSSGTSDRVMTSPDGITWTSRASATDNDWHSVTYGNGLFAAVSWTGNDNRVMTSD